MIDSSDHRPYHRTNTSTNDKLFICFTSRLSSSSSSSMKLSSKSILSPAHSARETTTTTTTPVNSLSTSLSRRLRSNNPTLKGAQSPMFPKKRGSGAAFDINPEPSSPKVTCIGQVRVKTKKKKQIRTLSKRRTTGGGEVSFRRFDSKNNRAVSNQNQECLRNRNQRWVHLPLTICEGLRAFGAEFSCLFPCRSSCGGERGKEEEKEKSSSSSSSSSCGAVFARWLVAVEGGGKGREIELVVGGDDDDDDERRREMVRREGSVLRRHLVEEKMEIGDDQKKFDELLKEEEEGRVSICIPPKNALLLMRCRSDPVRMSALANRFWESPPPICDEEDEEQDVEDEECEVVLIGDSKEEESAAEFVLSTKENEEEENLEEEEEENLVTEVQEIEETENPEENIENNEDEEEKQEESVVVDQEVNIATEAEENENEMFGFLFELLATDTEKLENQLELIQENEAEEFSSEMSVCPEDQVLEEEAGAQELEAALEEDNKSTGEKETLEEKVTQEAETMESEERESEIKKKEKEEIERSSVLPDCLLLMMCEPKLSMEVSKETWVCSTDFIRCLPERPPPVNAVDSGDDLKKRVSTDFNTAAAHHHQPPRSSCSLPAPAAVSMAAMIEQKLVNAVAYEPFVLTRCKSEPMRTAAAKLVPESCFWKNRKLEPHRRATFGVGAAGVGF